MFKLLYLFFKKNYEFIFCFILFGIILIISFNPAPYILSTWTGLTVWAKIVLPSLFVFFILTKLLMQSEKSLKIFSILDKPFNKLYSINGGGGYIFLMSALSGYPIGAKLISEFYEQKLISQTQAKKIISFASTSGPMFIIGSIAVKIFNSYKLGLVVLLSHLLSSLLNGLIYRNIGTKNGKNNTKNEALYTIKFKKQTLNDIMYNTITSILMIGGYITLCFTALELITSLSFFNNINTFFINLFGSNIFEAIIKGIVEVTNGCVSLTHSLPLKTICIILSSLISFGGLSIHLQSQMFLSKVGIKYRFFLLIKTTQTIITFIVSGIFSMILL